MHRVTAKITEEILVLFQHDSADPGARQQKSQHDPGRPAAGDAAGHLLRPAPHAPSFLLDPLRKP